MYFLCLQNQLNYIKKLKIQLYESINLRCDIKCIAHNQRLLQNQNGSSTMFGEQGNSFSMFRNIAVANFPESISNFYIQIIELNLKSIENKQIDLIKFQKYYTCYYKKWIKNIYILMNVYNWIKNLFINQPDKILSISNQYPQQIQKQLSTQSFNGVHKLILTSNFQMTNIPDNKNYTKLQLLEIISNKINNLQLFLENNSFDNLKILIIKNQKIRNLPKIKMSKIQNIQFEQCQIYHINRFSEGFYPKLSTFELTYGKLKQLPEIQLPLIDNLNFDCNYIQSVQRLFSSNKLSKNLRYLSLNINKIQKLPKLNCTQIVTLNVACNLICKVNEFFQNEYPKLNGLQLDRNRLSEFPLSKNKFKSLQHLNIGKNRIVNMQGLAFLQVPNLSQLRIQNNLITSCKSFQKSNLKQLYRINMKNNLLSACHLSRCNLSSEFVIMSLQTTQQYKYQDIIIKYNDYYGELIHQLIKSNISRVSHIEINSISLRRPNVLNCFNSRKSSSKQFKTQIRPSFY